MHYYECKCGVCVLRRNSDNSGEDRDGLEDSIFSASQSIQDLTLYASTCGSIKLQICTYNICKNTALHE